MNEIRNQNKNWACQDYFDQYINIPIELYGFTEGTKNNPSGYRKR